MNKKVRELLAAFAIGSLAGSGAILFMASLNASAAFLFFFGGAVTFGVAYIYLAGTEKKEEK